ncbi:hypothetical protein AMAG_04796 [Allomyces macrogynus ATCC 38327]|uniref:Uncharacterized protein n=1 Tax=Allomyces macrogynus (strain ATCC 38327) TaxID=578462 RepID=A0A0L0S6C4_ALLM3|nr:hypothetical protein AMAG_04796 [Allomyces macrogynus ATCC 38327]|eukprot:KNE57965.1 hypothetical protein AMAG_04796 [Allomyces macrogynus ATCC 38327]
MVVATCSKMNRRVALITLALTITVALASVLASAPNSSSAWPINNDKSDLIGPNRPWGGFTSASHLVARSVTARAPQCANRTGSALIDVLLRADAAAAAARRHQHVARGILDEPPATTFHPAADDALAHAITSVSTPPYAIPVPAPNPSDPRTQHALRALYASATAAEPSSSMSALLDRARDFTFPAFDKCTLTRTPIVSPLHNDLAPLTSHLSSVFRAIGGPAARTNLTLSRFDLWHAHLFVHRPCGRASVPNPAITVASRAADTAPAVGLLFHAMEYPALDERKFPVPLGWCQHNSTVTYMPSMMARRNVLWLLAPVARPGGAHGELELHASVWQIDAAAKCGAKPWPPASRNETTVEAEANGSASATTASPDVLESVAADEPVAPAGRTTCLTTGLDAEAEAALPEAPLFTMDESQLGNVLGDVYFLEGTPLAWSLN